MVLAQWFHGVQEVNFGNIYLEHLILLELTRSFIKE